MADTSKPKCTHPSTTTYVSHGDRVTYCTSCGQTQSIVKV